MSRRRGWAWTRSGYRIEACRPELASGEAPLFVYEDDERGWTTSSNTEPH